jgi:hypothetical protein
MPDAPWARRAAGSLANELARREPKRAHAVLGRTPLGDWRVSVRAPFATGHGAAALCQRFDGSGREAAAGIDSLPDGELDRFVQAFADAPWPVSAS